MATISPRYLTVEDVQPYLAGKVTFSNNPDNGLTPSLFAEQIALAETEVERDLSPFYQIPFTAIGGGDWTNLSPSSYAMLKNLLLVRAQLKIMRLNFGKNTNTNGQGYAELLEQDYETRKVQFYQQKPNTTFLFPCVDDLVKANNGINANNVLPGGKAIPLGGFNNRPNPLNYAASRLSNPAQCYWWMGKK